MNRVAIELVEFEQKSVLRQLLSLYKYDFTEYEPNEINEHGLFEYKYLDHYWTEAGRYPFLVRVGGPIAGFALMRETVSEGGTAAYFLSEFFIMRQYRRGGVGSYVATALFDRFPGTWTVRQVQANAPSHLFWRKVIGTYTGGRYEELQQADWNGPVQTFVSGGRGR